MTGSEVKHLNVNPPRQAKLENQKSQKQNFKNFNRNPLIDIPSFTLQNYSINVARRTPENHYGPYILTGNSFLNNRPAISPSYVLQEKQLGKTYATLFPN